MDAMAKTVANLATAAAKLQREHNDLNLEPVNDMNSTPAQYITDEIFHHRPNFQGSDGLRRSRVTAGCIFEGYVYPHGGRYMHLEGFVGITGDNAGRPSKRKVGG
ncbi:hypothetical protein FPCIR_12692 [Fusarium pseudocircinatum]|uniref:Uncharacterized protein n=1 Tax=Fusarium pseudocircinatum TaxID=56676 RepID=A0A8H5NTD5_9HYPO|nr:hypothetical protein FPCIR_12692 [Fusarium pseudocircinatum]